MLRLQSSTDTCKEDANTGEHHTTNFGGEEEEEEGESDETSLLKRDSEADVRARTDCIISNPVAVANSGVDLGVKSVGEESGVGSGAGPSGESGLGAVEGDEEAGIRVVGNGEREVGCEGEGEEEQKEQTGEEEEEEESEERKETKNRGGGEEGGVSSSRKIRNKLLLSIFSTLKNSWQDIKLFFRYVD